jgi:acetyl-CoA decarbonylase/synthase complex subunit gamma
MLPTLPADAGCGPAPAEVSLRPPRLDQAFVTGAVETPPGPVPRVSAALAWADHWGAVKARWGVGRMDYAVDPGLYALGEPDGESPVLVSANYKLSFDVLRGALPGRSAWILALDTQGINVWCAAGKGTFGTEELLRRIARSGLERIVAHRRLIIPQLGAPGVAAHEVKRRSGFTVRYGPIAAADLPAFLDAGSRATAAMRRKGFSLAERAVLIPIELVGTLKPALLIALPLFLLGGIGGPGGFWENAFRDGGFAVLAFLSAVLGGTILLPLLLPWLPGRAFAAKGLWLGAAIALLILAPRGFGGPLWAGRLETLAWLLVIPAVTAYLAMNFTGCSTYTSPSGVNREMRWALRAEIGLAAAGTLLWVAARALSWGGL